MSGVGPGAELNRSGRCRVEEAVQIQFVLYDVYEIMVLIVKEFQGKGSLGHRTHFNLSWHPSVGTVCSASSLKNPVQNQIPRCRAEGPVMGTFNL